MKKSIIIAVIASSLIVVSCCKRKSVPTDTNKSTVEEVKGTTEDKSSLEPITINSEYVWSGSTDAFTMLSKRVGGDTLYLEVQYGGGCEDHVFTLNTNMRWLKSMPPQLNLHVEHESKDDKCRALITKTLTFDLKTIQTPSSQAVKLIIDGDSENKLNYRY